jgi:hypothetical protein
MDIFALSGLLGTVLSIATFFIPDNWRSKKITLAIFVFLVAILCTIITNQNGKLTRIKKVSRAASSLSSKKNMEFTDEGYIQAGLTFLEQNKDMYPDSYLRAIKIYESYKSRKINYSTEVVSLASEMDGLIVGISVLNAD